MSILATPICSLAWPVLYPVAPALVSLGHVSFSRPVMNSVTALRYLVLLIMHGEPSREGRGEESSCLPLSSSVGEFGHRAQMSRRVLTGRGGWQIDHFCPGACGGGALILRWDRDSRCCWLRSDGKGVGGCCC